MGYEIEMQNDIVALLRAFADRVPDKETHAWVSEIAADSSAWIRAHDVFHRVRDRNLRANEAGDFVRECQYAFEEVCLQSLYNETHTDMPFDSCSPYWIIKNAIYLARAVGIALEDVMSIVAPAA